MTTKHVVQRGETRLHDQKISLTDYLHSMTIKPYLQVHLSSAILRALYWTSSGRSKRNKFNMAYHSTALKQKSPTSIMQLNGQSSSSTEKIENLQLLCCFVCSQPWFEFWTKIYFCLLNSPFWPTKCATMPGKWIVHLCLYCNWGVVYGGVSCRS